MFEITCNSAVKMTDIKGSTSMDLDIRGLHKEWDEASCPICMDHPHNAVLLLCSSHDKGCRSYICDTSYRHSNCLDRFKKLRFDARNSPPHPTLAPVESVDSGTSGQRSLQSLSPESIFENPRMRTDLVQPSEAIFPENSDVLVTLEENTTAQVTDAHLERQTTELGLDSYLDHNGQEELDGTSLSEFLHLKCPLCRGAVKGWKIIKEARQYLDLKQRSCSRESCSFSGNYRELRRHARRVHPTTRPADVDPSRQRAWRHLEHQREYGDIVSAIRSAMPGAIVLGDYVIDNGDRFPGDGEAGHGEGSGPWWTTFFLFHMISPVAPIDEPRGMSRAWRRHRRVPGFSSRRNLWGENLLGLQDDEEEDWNLESDIADDVPVPRRRRRLVRARPDEEPNWVWKSRSPERICLKKRSENRLAIGVCLTTNSTQKYFAIILRVGMPLTAHFVDLGSVIFILLARDTCACCPAAIIARRRLFLRDVVKASNSTRRCLRDMRLTRIIAVAVSVMRRMTIF
ncbi:hypothetical protein ACLOJK_011077 [Asimina triloba]